MSQDEDRREPSMDEIMSSIRRIITEGDDVGGATRRLVPSGPSDGRPVEVGLDEAPLLLTDIVREPGPASTTAPLAGGLALGIARDAPTSAERASPEGTPPASDLLSRAAAGAVTQTLARVVREASPSGSGGLPAARSLEDTVVDLLRPMLQAWLDQHLPAIVESVVEQEVKKLVRRAENL